MRRSVDAIEFAQELVPESVLPLVEAATWLGNVSTLAAVTALATIALGRNRGLYVLGAILGGFAILAGLKAALGLPRPPAEFHLIETETTGFPSGHALGATVVYGTLALALDGSRRLRLGIAAVLIAVVSLSRLVLGVHYPIDLVVGVAVGGGYLWAVDRYARGRPGRVLRVGAGLGLLAVVVAFAAGPTVRAACTGSVCLDRDAAAVGAAGVGALAGWYGRDRWSARRVLGGFVLPLFLLGTLALVAGETLVNWILAAALGAGLLAAIAGDRAPRSARTGDPDDG